MVKLEVDLGGAVALRNPDGSALCNSEGYEFVGDFGGRLSPTLKYFKLSGGGYGVTHNESIRIL